MILVRLNNYSVILKKYEKSINRNKLFLSQIKVKKKKNIAIKNNLIFLQKNAKVQNNVDFIFIFHFLYSNVFINVVNYSYQPFFNSSHGQLEIQGYDSQIKYCLFQYLTFIQLNLNHRCNVAIHYNGIVRSYFNKIIINFLKKYYIIKNIKHFNNIPHNGCRPRKVKRK